jgi:uncharacterized membrane protein
VVLLGLVVVLAILSVAGALGSESARSVPVFLALGALLGLTILSIVMIRWGWPWVAWRESVRSAAPVRWAQPGWEDPAVHAARGRYARGEITREQFDQMLTDLARRGRGPGGPLSGP